MSVEVSEKRNAKLLSRPFKKYQKAQDSIRNLSVKLVGNDVNDIQSCRTPTDVFQPWIFSRSYFDISQCTCQAVTAVP